MVIFDKIMRNHEKSLSHWVWVGSTTNKVTTYVAWSRCLSGLHRALNWTAALESMPESNSGRSASHVAVFSETTGFPWFFFSCHKIITSDGSMMINVTTCFTTRCWWPPDRTWCFFLCGAASTAKPAHSAAIFVINASNFSFCISFCGEISCSEAVVPDGANTKAVRLSKWIGQAQQHLKCQFPSDWHFNADGNTSIYGVCLKRRDWPPTCGHVRKLTIKRWNEEF